MFQDGTVPTNRADWLAPEDQAATPAFIHKPVMTVITGTTGAGKSSLISSMLSWSGTIRRAVSRRQLYTVTDRLPIYEKKSGSDLEPGANLEDKENGTDMSVLHLAASKFPDAVSLLSASASAIVATAWNSANNTAIIGSQHQVIETIISSGVRKIVPEATHN